MSILESLKSAVESFRKAIASIFNAIKNWFNRVILRRKTEVVNQSVPAKKEKVEQPASAEPTPNVTASNAKKDVPENPLPNPVSATATPPPGAQERDEEGPVFDISGSSKKKMVFSVDAKDLVPSQPKVVGVAGNIGGSAAGAAAAATLPCPAITVPIAKELGKAAGEAAAKSSCGASVSSAEGSSADRRTPSWMPRPGSSSVALDVD